MKSVFEGLGVWRTSKGLESGGPPKTSGLEGLQGRDRHRPVTPKKARKDEQGSFFTLPVPCNESIALASPPASTLLHLDLLSKSQLQWPPAAYGGTSWYQRRSNGVCAHVSTVRCCSRCAGACWRSIREELQLDSMQPHPLHAAVHCVSSHEHCRLFRHLFSHTQRVRILSSSHL